MKEEDEKGEKIKKAGKISIDHEVPHLIAL
jgi:hypothetical protein